MNPLVIILILIGCAMIIVGSLIAAGVIDISGSSSSPPSDSQSPSPAPAPVPAPTPAAYSGPSYASVSGPVNCAVSAWADSGSCSATDCGTSGTKTQTRTVTTPASNGGTACPPLTQTVSCNAPTCVTCPAGQELDRRLNSCILSQQQINTNLQQTYGVTVPTYNPPPPTDCQVSGWTPGCPDPSTLPCSGGMITQTRTITQNGANCPPLTQQIPCPGTCVQSYSGTSQTTNPSRNFCDPNPCDSNSTCMDFGNGQGMCQDQG